MKRASLLFVAALAAGLAFRDTASAQTVAREILTQTLPPMNGKTLAVHLVDVRYPPGGSSAPHEHPCPVSVYVVSGALRERVGAGPTRVLSAGESFYEAPNQLHAVSANASTKEPAHFIATFVCDKRTELSTKEHQ